MNLNLLPNIAYSMCINKEFLDNERAIEQEEKAFQREIDLIVMPPEMLNYRPLGFD